ncbi:TauD/TfdA family dioxygenase [Alcaligenaceae bacterium LF4-65]|uniref:TauD/TfdA family dioxygenase n=1 Tax=Zwartia hollandica TaxID=324606 RepID=A0A953NAY5_9BURK|nr:TauD/TfdA family dioxygenase [Zwartia hollandica]MBZ1350993.1 TauD/TfdA family dioxygenase [Zwartia hollandica]
MLSLQHPSNWRTADLQNDQRWIFRVDDETRQEMVRTVTAIADTNKTLFDYSPADFAWSKTLQTLSAALEEVKRGRGVALIKGLPREELTAHQFEILTWGLGLHSGVPRPQGKETQYISAVRNAGMDYRTGTGRGYSSNADLDFHTDSSDIIFLSCFNKAVSGGKTIISSSMAGHDVMVREYPDQVKWLYEPIAFSRQGEQAPDEGPYVVMPIFSECKGKWFGRWNWNRVRSAQKIEGAPQLKPEQFAALEQFDQVMRRPDVAYEMWLEPGDVQIISSHVTLHSRTEFVDHEDPAKKRLLYRLWIAPPDSDQMPESWRDLYRSCEPGTVRGGIRGFKHDERCKQFEARQAKACGMRG